MWILPQILLPNFCFLLGFKNVSLYIPASSVILFQAALPVKVLVFITGIVQSLAAVRLIQYSLRYGDYIS